MCVSMVFATCGTRVACIRAPRASYRRRILENNIKRIAFAIYQVWYDAYMWPCNLRIWCNIWLWRGYWRQVVHVHMHTRVVSYMVVYQQSATLIKYYSRIIRSTAHAPSPVTAQAPSHRRKRPITRRKRHLYLSRTRCTCHRTCVVCTAPPQFMVNSCRGVHASRVGRLPQYQCRRHLERLGSLGEWRRWRCRLVVARTVWRDYRHAVWQLRSGLALRRRRMLS